MTAYSPGGAFNRYWYANNNPFRFTDPDGRQSEEDGDKPTGNCAPETCSKPEAHEPETPTLPDNPSGLGEGWGDVTPQGGQNPKIPKRYRGPNGTEVEFDPADPDKPSNTWGGKNHWHDVNPETGKRQGGHLLPGSPIPGPDGQSESRTMMDRMEAITPGPIVKWGTTAIIIYVIVSEGSRIVFPPRNLVPVP